MTELFAIFWGWLWAFCGRTSRYANRSAIAISRDILVTLGMCLVVAACDQNAPSNHADDAPTGFTPPSSDPSEWVADVLESDVEIDPETAQLRDKLHACLDNTPNSPQCIDTYVAILTDLAFAPGQERLILRKYPQQSNTQIKKDIGSYLGNAIISLPRNPIIFGPSKSYPEYRQKRFGVGGVVRHVGELFHFSAGRSYPLSEEERREFVHQTVLNGRVHDINIIVESNSCNIYQVTDEYESLVTFVEYINVKSLNKRSDINIYDQFLYSVCYYTGDLIRLGFLDKTNITHYRLIRNIDGRALFIDKVNYFLWPMTQSKISMGMTIDQFEAAVRQFYEEKFGA